MDDVEDNILTAWFDRLLSRLQRDPHELARRLARRTSATLQRPPRPWCIALRANDARLGEGVSEWGVSEYRSNGADDFPPRHPDTPYPVTLDRDAIVAITRPVSFEDAAPGLSVTETAQRLGVSRGGLLRARVAKLFRTHHVEGLGGHWGHPHPILYTDADLDPQSRRFAMPDRAWSWTAGRYLAHRLPKDLPPQTLTRVGHFAPIVGKNRYRDTRGLHPEHPLLDPPQRPPRKSLALPKPEPDVMAWYKWKDGVFLGYDWRQPGAKQRYEKRERALAKARAAAKRRRIENPKPSKSKGSLAFRGYRWLCPTCGRRVKVLYLPVRPMNLIAEIYANRGDRSEFRRLIQSAGAPAAQRWWGTPAEREHRTFACAKCHRVRSLARGKKSAWGELVAALTGGLLYGHEVKRPPWFPRHVSPQALEGSRQLRYAPRVNRPPSVRRAQIEAGLLAGQDMKTLAAAIGLKKGTVLWYAQQIYRQHHVGSLKELLIKHGKPTRPHMRGRALGKRGERRMYRHKRSKQLSRSQH